MHVRACVRVYYTHLYSLDSSYVYRATTENVNIFELQVNIQNHFWIFKLQGMYA